MTLMKKTYMTMSAMMSERYCNSWESIILNLYPKTTYPPNNSKHMMTATNILARSAHIQINMKAKAYMFLGLTAQFMKDFSEIT